LGFEKKKFILLFLFVGLESLICCFRYSTFLPSELSSASIQKGSSILDIVSKRG